MLELFCLFINGLRLSISSDDVDLTVPCCIMIGRSLATLISLLDTNLVSKRLIISTYRPYVSVATGSLCSIDGCLFCSCSLDFMQVKLVLLFHWKFVYRHLLMWYLLLGLEVCLLHSVTVGQIRCLTEAGDGLLLLLLLRS